MLKLKSICSFVFSFNLIYLNVLVEIAMETQNCTD